MALLAIAGLSTVRQDLPEVLHHLLITEAQERTHQRIKDLLALADQVHILHHHVLHLPIALQEAQEDHLEVLVVAVVEEGINSLFFYIYSSPLSFNNFLFFESHLKIQSHFHLYPIT